MQDHEDRLQMATNKNHCLGLCLTSSADVADVVLFYHSMKQDSDSCSIMSARATRQQLVLNADADAGVQWQMLALALEQTED